MQYINSVTYDGIEPISYDRHVLGRKDIIHVEMRSANKSLIRDIEIDESSKLHSNVLLK